jgi:mannitol-1-phosphate 5-dehydrogenase
MARVRQAENSGVEQMSQKSVVIWGAGRIGRGYVADLFDAAGYRITLVGRSPELMARLQAAGYYTIAKVNKAGQRRDQVITGYTALSTAQAVELAAAVAAADNVVVAVFPRDFRAVVEQLAPGVLRRRAERPGTALDILLCANLVGAVPRFQSLLLQALLPEAQAYAAERIGVVGTLVMRGVVEPPPGVREEDPLLVWTDGFGEFPVDRHAFKGDIPHIPDLRLVEDMTAEETRKLYTYNMFHAALAYLGARRGHVLIADCMADPRVRVDVEGALHEASLALGAKFGVSEEDTARWTGKVLNRMDNPALGDRVTRVGADPRRKLRRDDRLVGPALMARAHGIPPLHLARAIAAALWFENSADAGALYVRERIAEMGLPAAVRELCELNAAENDLAALIEQAYQDLAVNENTELEHTHV